MRSSVSLTSVMVALLGTTVLARAEIGVPAATGGVYVSLGSGYHHENGSNVAAQGTTQAGSGNGAGGAPASNANADTDLTGAGAGSAPGFGTANAFANAPGQFSAATANGTTASALAGGPATRTSDALANSTPSGTSGSSASAGTFGVTSAATATPSSSSATAQAGGPGATATAIAAAATTSLSSSSDLGSFIKAQSGAFGDVEVGYVLPAPLYSVTRVEIYATGSMASQNNPVQGGFGFRGVDNNSAFAVAATPFGSLSGAVTQRDDLGEIGLRIKVDRRIGPVFAALSAEPFYLDFRQLTTSYAGGANSFGQRTSNVHGQLYSGQIAAEAVLPVLGRVSLVGRGSVGAYSLQSSGAFSSLVSTTTVGQIAALSPTIPFSSQLAGSATDAHSRTGFRAGAQVGVRYAIAPTAWFTVLASVDHLSDVPTAVLPRLAGDRPAYVASRGYTDLRIGGRLTVATLDAP